MTQPQKVSLSNRFEGFVVGRLLSDVRFTTSKAGKPMAKVFIGGDVVNYWGTIFDAETLKALESVSAKDVVAVKLEIVHFNESEDSKYKSSFNCNVLDLQLLEKFGEKSTAENAGSHDNKKWGDKSTAPMNNASSSGNQGGQSAPIGNGMANQSNEPPMDFDDDIPF